MANCAQIIPFHFEAHEIRAYSDEAGEPWLCAADLCSVLGYRNAADAIAKHCREAGIAKRDISSGGQKRSVTFINEGNLYRLIIKSRKEEALRFEAWVCDEVLPAIRKHGRYEDHGNQLGTLIGQTIGTNGFNCLAAVVDGKVRHLPAPARRGAKNHLWSQVHKAFSVVSVEDIPASQLDSARNFIAAYVLEGEFLPKAPCAADQITLTPRQAEWLTTLLHSADWVSYRWGQGIEEGVKALNPQLYSRTFEHFDTLLIATRTLDTELSGTLRRFRRGELRPDEMYAGRPG